MLFGATSDLVPAGTTMNHMIAVGMTSHDLCTWSVWVLPSVHQAASSS